MVFAVTCENVRDYVIIVKVTRRASVVYRNP